MKLSLVVGLCLVSFWFLLVDTRPLVRYQELLRTVKLLQSLVDDTNPASLYSPEAVEGNCLQPALECFQNQSSLLKEVTGSKASLFKIAMSLLKQRRSEKYPELNKQCKACEFYRKETPKNFLKSMESLIQQIIQSKGELTCNYEAPRLEGQSSYDWVVGQCHPQDSQALTSS